MRRWAPWCLLLMLAAVHSSWAAAPAGLPVIEGHGTVFTISATVASTGNVNRDNPGTSTFDGVTLSTGTDERFRRVLLWQQNTPSQNGVYIWKGSGVAMSRPDDADGSFDLRPGLVVEVIRGTTHAGKEFQLQGTGFPTVDTTTLTFVRDNRFEPPATVQLLDGASAIQCGAPDAALRVIPVRSSTAGTPVTITAEPPIALGVNGQVCIIQGTDDEESVTVNTPDYTLTFTAGVVHALVYSTDTGDWKCLSCGTGEGGGGGPSTDDLNAVHLRGGRIKNATVLNPVNIEDPNSTAKIVFYWAGGVPVVEFLGVDGTPMNRNRLINAGKSDTITTDGAECEQTTGAGVHSYSNTCKATKSIEFPAGALSTDGTNCGTPTEQVLNSGPKMWAFSCADSNSSVFYGSVSMLRTGWDAGPVQFTLHLFHGSTETITFAGDFSAQCRGDSDPINNTWGTAVAADVAITTANDTERQTTADVTPEGTCQPGDMINWRYVVDATNFSANAANAKVLKVNMHYKLKSRNGVNE